MATHEFIDFGFRPKLPSSVSGDFRLYVYEVKMCDIGKPAPTFTDDKAAVWVGERPDRDGEVPTLAVVTARTNRVIDKDSRWYVGVIAASALEELQTIDSIAPREALILQATDQQVYPNQHRQKTVDVTDAFKLLMRLHPR